MSCRSLGHLLSLLLFASVAWKYETFRDQWIPLNSVSEVSMREQGQRRLQARKEWPRTDSIYIKYKRVCKIVYHFENARFSYVLAQEEKNGSGSKPFTLASRVTANIVFPVVTTEILRRAFRPKSNDNSEMLWKNQSDSFLSFWKAKETKSFGRNSRRSKKQCLAESDNLKKRGRVARKKSVQVQNNFWKNLTRN